MDISNQLSHARLARGEDLAALGRRIGVRLEHLRAIEDGRFADLPAGIYGRAAVRSFANAVGFDGAAILAECESRLTPLEEPIAGLARARGLRVRAAEPPRTSEPSEDVTNEGAFPGWRHLAASAIDACAIGALLVVLVIAALTMMTVPVSALRDSGGAFAMMGLLLAAAYYVCFGGVRGATVGERVLALEPRRPVGPAVTLRMVAERALLAATEDARCLQRWGERLAEYADIQRAKRSA